MSDKDDLTSAFFGSQTSPGGIMHLETKDKGSFGVAGAGTWSVTTEGDDGRSAGGGGGCCRRVGGR